jgi:hypothetical protein
MLFFKKTKTPVSDELKIVETVQLWEVQWTSRHGGFSSDTRPEFEVFTSEEAAKGFRDSLIAAFKLVKHTHGTNVDMRKRV